MCCTSETHSDWMSDSIVPRNRRHTGSIYADAAACCLGTTWEVLGKCAARPACGERADHMRRVRVGAETGQRRQGAVPAPGDPRALRALRRGALRAATEEHELTDRSFSCVAVGASRCAKPSGRHPESSTRFEWCRVGVEKQDLTEEFVIAQDLLVRAEQTVDPLLPHRGAT